MSECQLIFSLQCIPENYSRGEASPLVWISFVFGIMLLHFIYLVLFVAGFPVFLAGQGNVIVLGIAQDGGFPHAGCEKECCRYARIPGNRQMVASLALADSVTGKWWLFDATPDMPEQLHLFDSLTGHRYPYLPSGIFLTHAHIGHYTGLMHLGREVMGAKQVPVYVLPRMANFLKNNGPWSQLVALQNIEVRQISPDSAVQLTDQVKVTPFLVPHRDEYSETAGFSMDCGRRYLFIPDIDKWQKWNRDIGTELGKHDIAFIDGTFLDAAELPGRNMEEVPHPFIPESMELLKAAQLLQKVRFIHFNHTNRVMRDAVLRKKMEEAGAGFARTGQRY